MHSMGAASHVIGERAVSNNNRVCIHHVWYRASVPPSWWWALLISLLPAVRVGGMWEWQICGGRVLCGCVRGGDAE